MQYIPILGIFVFQVNVQTAIQTVWILPNGKVPCAGVANVLEMLQMCCKACLRRHLSQHVRRPAQGGG